MIYVIVSVAVKPNMSIKWIRIYFSYGTLINKRLIRSTKNSVIKLISYLIKGRNFREY